jgi:LPXTG-motif cell wall-anchored protein
MRRTIAVVSATGALLFGGAGIANATVETAPAPSTTTTLADNTSTNTNDQHNDNAGLWGLLGLLGLGGLIGLKRRKDTDVRAGVGTSTTPGRGV